MAAGAVAGAAAGLYLGRRYRSFDAFVEDMRDRLGDLRTIWYNDELAAEERGARIADAVDDFEEDEEADDLEDDLDDEDFDDGAGYHEAYAVLDDEDLDEDEDEDFDDEVDELEDELAAVTASNGVVGSRAADKARQLEERVLDALHHDDLLSERAIEIAVVGDGVVELTGTVHAIEEVSRASAMVRGVAGVSMVLNRIDVRAGGTMDTASVPREPMQPPAKDERPAPGS